MSTRFRLANSIAVAVMAAAMLCACDNSVRPAGPDAKLQIVRVDSAQNRLWVLDRDAVVVHDNTNGRRLRRIVLPEWILVGNQYSCPPDLALDTSGAAFVSSNVMPVIWRIDPRSYEVTRIELALDSDNDKDVGFTALSFGRDGTLLAASAMSRSLWQIDTKAASARKIASPSLSAVCVHNLGGA
jgi:hypothetical protein